MNVVSIYGVLRSESFNSGQVIEVTANSLLRINKSPVKLVMFDII